jgi:hypothetical protein
MGNTKRVKELKNLISNWDKLSLDNVDNENNLSTSERQDWVDELMELESED